MAARGRRLDLCRPAPPGVPEGPDAGARHPHAAAAGWPGTLNPDFLDLLAALVRAEARFLVVGAHAMAAHGVPRATGDLDALLDNKRATARAKDLADVEILERRERR